MIYLGTPAERHKGLLIFSKIRHSHYQMFQFHHNRANLDSIFKTNILFLIEISRKFPDGKIFDSKPVDLSDCNWTRTQNHLVRKRTLNHLANLAR